MTTPVECARQQQSSQVDNPQDYGQFRHFGSAYRPTDHYKSDSSESDIDESERYDTDKEESDTESDISDLDFDKISFDCARLASSRHDRNTYSQDSVTVQPHSIGLAPTPTRPDTQLEPGKSMQNDSKDASDVDIMPPFDIDRQSVMYVPPEQLHDLAAQLANRATISQDRRNLTGGSSLQTISQQPVDAEPSTPKGDSTVTTAPTHVHVHGNPRQILVLQDVTNIEPIAEYNISLDSENYEGESDTEDIVWDSILDVDSNIPSQADHTARYDRDLVQWNDRPQGLLMADIDNTHCRDSCKQLAAIRDTQDWQFRPDLFKGYDVRYGRFDVDACADNEGRNSQCEHFWCPQDSYSNHSWAGKKVWCKPPFDEIKGY